MKKILLFLICIAMIISAVPTIAMEEPENVIEDIVCGEEKVSGIITNTKCDTTGVQVSVVGDTHTTFGGAESILDGLGMTTVTDGSESPATFDTSVGNKKWRWTAKDSTVCPIFAIKLSSPIELSRIDFTEARKTIEGYTVTLKNNGTTIKTVSGSFSDSTTTNALYLRKIQLGEKVTADEIIFEVTSRASNSSVMSITEMELILESSTKVSISNANFHASSGMGETLMDGKAFKSDGSTLALGDRVVVGNETPTITIEFEDVITFDTIKHAEVRSLIKTYQVTAYKDGQQVFVSDNLTFPDSEKSTGTGTTIREMNIGQSVTADKVVIDVISLYDGVTNVVSISEIEFWSSSKAPVITNENMDILSPSNGIYGNMFDSDAATSCKVDASELDEANVCFCFSEPVTADSIKIVSDDFSHIVLYGSIDGENYFEIPHQGIDSEGVCNFNSTELLVGVKAQLVLNENANELELAEIEMYRLTEDAFFDELAKLFLETDTSMITDENLSAVTHNINNPLPDSFGLYNIEWESSNSDLLDVDTGEITPSYMKQDVTLTASFKRDGITYKENIYNITISEDFSLLPTGKYNYSDEKVNLSGHIISSSVFDVNGEDPSNPAAGGVATLYDEPSKINGFSGANANSWATYAMVDAQFEAHPMPYTLQFDFDDTIALNTIDIWEYRDRLTNVSVYVSTDGETWHPAIENASTPAQEVAENDASIVRKSIYFPLVYAKHVRVIINEVIVSTKSAATKISEIVFSNEQILPKLNDTESSYATDSDTETYLEIGETGSIVVDMGEIVGFDSLKWMNTGAPVNEYAVSVSNNGADWHQVKAGQLSNSAGVLKEIDLEEYSVARYVKLDINSVHTDNSAKICELFFTEDSGFETYRTEKNFLRLITFDETDILVGEALTLLTVDELDAIVENVDFYNLSWDFSKAPMINPETKEVIHTEEDVVGKIGVNVVDSTTGYTIYKKEFDVISKAAFDEASYYTATQQNTVMSGEYDLDCPDGFVFNQDNMMIEFSMDDDGKVVFNGESELLSVTLNGDELTISYKDREKTVKCTGNTTIRAFLNRDSFDFYLKDNGIFRGIIAGGGYKSDFTNGISSIDTEVILSDVKFMIHKEYIADFLNQLNFSHISTESMYGVTENLSLINEIIGLDINWSSDNIAVNPQTGEVVADSEPGYAILTASVNESGVIEWNKNLYAAVNMENVILNAVVSTNTAAYQGNVLTNAYDTDIDTSFSTNYKNGYNVKITFAEKIPVAQIALIEDNSKGSIDEFDIYIDNILVYEGKTIDGFKNCLFDSVMGKEVKIDIKKTTGITGFKEISVHSELSDMQKATSDLKSVGLLSSYENGTYTLPKTGEYGSAITYSADKSIVSFEENTDSFTMTVDNDSVDTAVVVTLTATLNGKQASKTYSIIAKGKQSVSYDPPSGGGGGGGSSSGGSSGGGNNTSYAPDGTTASPEPVTSEKDELYGHWAEQEIRSLVNRGIVQGTGDSLNLDSKVTRAEFLTMLTRVLETELSENAPVFSDVKNSDWYANVVQTAYEKGWVEGYNNNVSPNSYITREEMVKIICCALEIVYDENTQAAEFTDGDMQSEWAINYISALSSKNIINGYEDGSFRPKNNLKRDEAMIVIYRICNMEVE